MKKKEKQRERLGEVERKRGSERAREIERKRGREGKKEREIVKVKNMNIDLN